MRCSLPAIDRLKLRICDCFPLITTHPPSLTNCLICSMVAFSAVSISSWSMIGVEGIAGGGMSGFPLSERASALALATKSTQRSRP